MGILNLKHIISICFTLLLVVLVGIYSGKKVKSASDFMSGGRKASWKIVTGTIIGTLVGGSSTVGTVEMAYHYGFSAWWFTLGAGIGCLLLGIFFTKPLRKFEASTISEILAVEYGPKAGLYSGLFSSVGMFLNIIAQVLSLIALFSGILNMPSYIAAIIGISLMAFYVIFGGVWGAGLVGILKTVLLYITMLSAGIIAYIKAGGISGFTDTFSRFPWFSLFGRGYLRDMAAGFSLVLGVLSTQTYIQAVLSGKDEKASKSGALVAAFLTPLIGLAGISIGLFMRKNFPDIMAGEAFPKFILTYMNPWLGGAIIGTLFIAIIGTGAGLTLGISTVLTNDIYRHYIDSEADDRKLLRVSRVLIIFILGATLLFVSGNLKSLILEWSFLSMGLRGATTFIPMCVALFFKGKIPSKVGIASILLGPLVMLLVKILGFSVDPLYIGILASLGTVILGTKYYHNYSEEVKKY